MNWQRGETQSWWMILNWQRKLGVKCVTGRRQWIILCLDIQLSCLFYQQGWINFCVAVHTNLSATNIRWGHIVWIYLPFPSSCQTSDQPGFISYHQIARSAVHLLPSYSFPSYVRVIVDFNNVKFSYLLTLRYCSISMTEASVEVKSTLWNEFRWTQVAFNSRRTMYCDVVGELYTNKHVLTWHSKDFQIKRPVGFRNTWFTSKLRFLSK